MRSGAEDARDYMPALRLWEGLLGAHVRWRAQLYCADAAVLRVIVTVHALTGTPS